MLTRNIVEINEKINDSAIKSGRRFTDIKVIPVTKYVPDEVILQLKALGYKDFAESRVQELIKKHENLSDCSFQFIGRLQTNKINQVIERVSLIQSVGSIELAKEIDFRAEKNGKTVNILLQVNASGELTKQGIFPENLIDEIKNIQKLKHIKIYGLMTMAPYTDQMEDVRLVFRKIKRISLDIEKENLNNVSMKILSMGMSNDFETAVEEGANLLRIGSAFFRGITI